MNSIVAEKRYIASKLGVPYESLSQSYLRAETPVGTQSVVDFTLQTNKVLAPVVSERLLDLNDEFVITHFQVGIKNVSDPSSDTNQLTSPVETYDSRNFGGTIGVTPAYSTTEQMGIATIYNGDLSFTIDRKEFVPNFPVRAFYRVPDLLQADGGETNVGIPSLVPGNIGNGGRVLAQTETSLYGFYPSEPTKIDGRQTIDLSINLGSNIDLAPVPNTGADGTNYVVFEARGYLITNAND